MPPFTPEASPMPRTSITPSFFLTRPASIKSYALSAPVGSGKTRAAIHYICRPEMAAQNFLYVAPTIRLLEQTARDLDSRLEAQQDPRRVTVVHSRSVNAGELPARAEALRVMNEVESGEGCILVLTTQTFLAILADIAEPEHWRVILDEAFSPVTFGTFELGDDPEANWAYFAESFEVDPQQGHRVVPREGQHDRVRDIAAGRWHKVGGKCKGLQELARMVANPAMRCELAISDRVRDLLSQRQSPTAEPVRVLHFASYVSPEHFRRFREVLFLSALFEQTVLYHLWTRALGVTFSRHPNFPEELLRDTHGEQGPLVSVGHLLHENDRASLYNLSRNALTGQPGERKPGMRTIDHLVRTAAAYFHCRPWLLQVNDAFGFYGDRVPPSATRIPTLAHGLNEFQDHDNVVALAMTNPNPQQLEWVQSRTGLSADEVTQAFRIHTCYQAVGRSSIRKAEPTKDRKTFLVAGYADARFLADLFPGSQWLGQIGDHPSVQRLAGENKVDGVTALTRAAIQHYLDSLPEDTLSKSTRAAKAEMRYDGGESTWNRAVRDGLNGWRLQGRSLVRVRWEDFFPVNEESVAAET
jgi:hypothetical protein